MSDFWTILISAIGFGAAGEMLRRYRSFKAHRRSNPSEIRNAGFWTDSRIAHAEMLFSAMAMAIPFSAGIPLIAADRPFWVHYPALLIYALFVYLLVVSLNLPATPRPPEGRS